ncbi:MAG: hypothetical protein D6744_18405 [Planctomycetota bacterium]|nr:MAG: hypothetical protein D6744_18405 [Planctomycetota bacterium]
MKTLTPPKSFESVPTGGAMTALEEQGAALYVRLADVEFHRLPRLCLLDLRLGAWLFDEMIVTAFMLRVEKQIDLTYRVWLNGANPTHVGVLKNLSRQRDVRAHLIAPCGQRTLRTRNSVSVRAARIVAALLQRRTWSDDEFEQAAERLDSLYPTSSRLWMAIRDEPFPL